MREKRNPKDEEIRKECEERERERERERMWHLFRVWQSA